MVNGYEMREGTDDEKIKEWTHIIKGIGTILVGVNDNEKSNVYEIDRYTYQNSGTLTTNEILIGDPTKKKSIRQIYCLVKIKPNTKVRVEYSIDGSETFNRVGEAIGGTKTRTEIIKLSPGVVVDTIKLKYTLYSSGTHEQTPEVLSTQNRL